MQNILVDPKKVMRDNLAFLRSYAQRTIEGGDTEGLAAIENVKEALMVEFLSVGKGFRLTDRDMAVMLLKGVLTPQRSIH